MSRIDVIAAGKMRAGPHREMWDEYAKRMKPAIALYEIEGRSHAEELKKLEEKIDPHAYLFILDEKGKNLRSLELAARLENLASQGRDPVQFLIGGADGLSEKLRNRADFLLSFGSMTWPHMLARVMLIEQIYRARQITAGHPYHRE